MKLILQRVISASVSVNTEKIADVSKGILVFFGVACAGFVTQICLTQSLKMSDTTFVMPLQFTKLVWLSLIGYFIFVEIPVIWTWIGAIIIFSAVMYITYREAFRKKDIP